MKYLNLYAGIGGNRKLLNKNVKVTAIEFDEKIAALYKKLYPEDEVIVTDAHEYLLNNFKDFDFIWSSPPCQSHSKMIRSGRNRKPRYVDLRLYEEIIFLQTNFKGLWVVENVVPFYEPLLPAKKIGRHLFWSNFDIPDFDPPKFENFINKQNLENKKELQNWLGIHYTENIYYGNNHCPTQILRNCVHPIIGKKIFDAAVNDGL